MVKQKTKKTGSLTGYHFMSCFNTCRRKWLIRYYFSIIPEWTKPPLIFGTIVHASFEAYHRARRNPEMLIHAFNQGMKEIESEYMDKGTLNNDFERGELMLSKWLEEHHENDQKHLETLLIEEELRATLPNGKVMTIRPDYVAKDKLSNEVLVFDYKTTGFSIPVTFQTCDTGDQATCYLWALDQLYPDWKIDTFIPDIIYRKGNVTKAERPGYVYRSKKDFARFEKNYSTISSEIDESVSMLEENPKLIDELFPRCACEELKWRCEYIDVCRDNITPSNVPVGFKIER